MVQSLDQEMRIESPVASNAEKTPPETENLQKLRSLIGDWQEAKTPGDASWQELDKALVPFGVRSLDLILPDSATVRKENVVAFLDKVETSLKKKNFKKKIWPDFLGKSLSWEIQKK